MSFCFLTRQSLQKALEVEDQRRTLTFEAWHPLFALPPPCLDFFDCRSTISFFFIRIRVAAPGSPVKKQSIEFFFGLRSGGLGVHSVSKHTPPQLDLHPQMLGLSLRRSLRKTCSETSNVRVPRVVKVGHRFFCDNMKLSQSSASWRPGSMMATVSLSPRAPCHAAEHFCENTSQRMPSCSTV